MARNKECLYDQGGYFIINGSEKVIVAQERQACNIVLVFNVKLNNRYSWNAQIRSQNEQSNKPALQFKVNIEKPEKGGHIMATIPKIRADIPIVILFRALGCTSDEQIFNMVMTDPNDTPMSEALRPSLEQAKGYYTQEQCLDFIAQRGGPMSLIEANRDGTERTGIQKKQRRIQFAQLVLRDDLLPHVGIKAGDEYKKAFFAGYMTNRLIQAALGRTTEDDRDYYGKKRMDMAGALLAMIFRQEFRKVITDMQKHLQRDMNNNNRRLMGRNDRRTFQLRDYFKCETISNGLRTALATGNWGKDKDNNVLKTGVSQVVNRLTFASFLSHLRRVTTPLDKKGKQAKPRQLHNSHWGMVCPAETPEGSSCGLVKNLTLMAQISVGQRPSEVL